MKNHKKTALVCAVLSLTASAALASGTIPHDAQSICTGGTTTFQTTTVGDKYEWSPTQGLSATNTRSVSVTRTTGYAEETVYYTCTVTKNGGTVTTGNLVGGGDFEFSPSQNQSNREKQINDPITGKTYSVIYETYTYGEFKTDGTCDPGNYTTTQNPANIKADYFVSLQPKTGNWMLAVDGKNEPNWKVWQVRNLQLKGGQKYEFSCWAANIDKEYITKQHGTISLPKLKFVIEDCTTGGERDLGDYMTLSDELGVWQKYSATYTPSQDCNWAHITIYNSTAGNEGNDFALDNIYFGAANTTADDVTTETFPLIIKDCSTSLDWETDQCYGSTYEMSARTAGGSNYKWTAESGTAIPYTGQKWVIVNARPEKYTCVITMPNGTTVTEHITFKTFPQLQLQFGDPDGNPFEACVGETGLKLDYRMPHIPADWDDHPDQYAKPEAYRTTWTKNGTAGDNGKLVHWSYEPYIKDIVAPSTIGAKDDYTITIGFTNTECSWTAATSITAKDCTEPEPKETEWTKNICSKGRYEISAQTDGTNYKWNDGTQGRTITVEDIYSTDLVCTLTMSDGNTMTETVHVIADLYPGDDQPKEWLYCENSEGYTLEVSDPDFPSDYQQHPEKYPWNPQYQWSKNGTNIEGEQGKFLIGITMPPAGEKHIYVRKVTNGECQSQTTFNITGKNCTEVSTKEVCTGTPLELSSNVSDAVEYFWSTEKDTKSITVPTDNAGSKRYTCTSFAESDGLHIEHFDVTVNPIYDIALTGEVCQGEKFSRDGFEFSAEETASGEKIEKTQNLKTKGCQCDSIVTFTLTINEKPEFTVSAEGREIVIDVTKGTAPYTFTIDGKQNYTNPIIENLSVGTHTILTTDAKTCSSTGSVSIEMRPVDPMVFFTPNGDGLNDLWLVRNIEFYPNALIQIFDRHHKLLLSCKASEFKGWDGTYNGHELRMDDYWYVITSEEFDKALSGHFILKK